MLEGECGGAARGTCWKSRPTLVSCFRCATGETSRNKDKNVARKEALAVGVLSRVRCLRGVIVEVMFAGVRGLLSSVWDCDDLDGAMYMKCLAVARDAFGLSRSVDRFS